MVTHTNETRGAAGENGFLLMAPEHTPVVKAVVGGAELLGLAPMLVRSPEEVLRGIAANPSCAAFPLDAERVAGRRLERVLRHANPTVPLIAFGPIIRASVVCRLRSVGVAVYIDEGLTAREMAAQIGDAMDCPDRLVEAARAEVGRRDLKEAQRVVRLTMCAEAIARCGGSRRAAARLLGVDRRAVQKVVKQLEDPDMKLARPLAPARFPERKPAP